MGNSVKITRHSDDSFIDPATEDLQRIIQQALEGALIQSSSNFGSEKLTATVAGTTDDGADQPCKSVLAVSAAGNTGTVHVDKAGKATLNSFPVGTSPVPIPVTNTDQISLHFTDASDVAYLLWRN